MLTLGLPRRGSFRRRPRPGGAFGQLLVLRCIVETSLLVR